MGGLLGALGHSDAGVRAEAADTLGHTGEVGAIEPLIGALSDPRPSVRKAVVSALCVLGQKLDDARVSAALKRALGDHDRPVRQTAAQRLQWLGVSPDDIERAKQASGRWGSGG